MIYVSFVEILVKAEEKLTTTLGTELGTWITVAAFFGGIALIALIDFLVPNYENPPELHSLEEMDHGLESPAVHVTTE
jgi:ZIP family zinc transporter